MKKLLLTLIGFALIANVSSQLKIDASGNVGIGKDPQYKLDIAGDIYFGSASNILGTTNNDPIMFKVNNFLVGYTGSYTSNNVSFGCGALSNPLAGIQNTAYGFHALNANTTGNFNTANGWGALGSNTTSNYNTANGWGALYTNTVGSDNTAIGAGALYSNTTGSNNAATGNGALHLNTTGNFNTANGYSALRLNTTGESNTATGWLALYANTTGNENTANGHTALASNTTGNANAAFGKSALNLNTTGSNNAAFGSYALNLNTTGEGNTATGHAALHKNTTGSGNTAFGGLALYHNTTGDFNTAIGFWAGTENPNNLTNTTTIGCFATATGSDQVMIGNSGVRQIGGFAAWSNFSDGRAKKNIRADVPGLAFINSLRPVTYNLDLDVVDNLVKVKQPKNNKTEQPMPQALKEITDKSRKAKQEKMQTGFVAQDVEKAAKSIGYNFSGVNVDESGIYSLRYAEFVVPLVKAVQELSEQNGELRETINKLNTRIEQLEKKLK